MNDLFENKQAGVLGFNCPFAFPRKENNYLRGSPTLENNLPDGFQLELHQNFFKVIYLQLPTKITDHCLETRRYILVTITAPTRDNDLSYQSCVIRQQLPRYLVLSSAGKVNQGRAHPTPKSQLYHRMWWETQKGQDNW